VRSLVLYLGLAWQGVSPDVVQHVQAGMEAQKQGHLKEAIAEFKKVTELMPNLPAAFANLGAAYMQDKQYGAAIAPLKHALELNPDLIGVHQMLGYALLEQGYTRDSIPHLEKAHLQDALGVAQLKLGNYSAAIPNLQAALQKRPNDPELLYYLGRASGLLSRQVLDTLESAYPDSARAHQSLGENYAVLRRIPEAEKEYREALRLQPNAPGIHLELGQLYAAEKDWPKAEAEFRAEAEIEPGDAETSYRYGNALLEQGKLKGALAELQRADRLQPDMPETLYALGKAASLSGDAATAEKAWRSVVTLDKNTSLAAQAHFGLATLYRKQGKTAQAAQELSEFHRIQAPGKK
jgi:tetratricopeptide (TPR) repeat protein